MFFFSPLGSLSNLNQAHLGGGGSRGVGWCGRGEFRNHTTTVTNLFSTKEILQPCSPAGLPPHHPNLPARQKYHIVVNLFLLYVQTSKLSGLLYPVQIAQDEVAWVKHVARFGNVGPIHDPHSLPINCDATLLCDITTALKNLFQRLAFSGRSRKSVRVGGGMSKVDVLCI